MSIPMQLLLVVAAFCVLSDGAPDGRIARAKQQRPTRGFKNLEMMTARGFGKRGRVSTRSERDVGAQTPPERTYRATPTYKSPAQHYARDFGKRTPEMEPEGEIRDQTSLERTYRTPTFHSSSSNNYARDFGKRTPEMEQEGDMPDQFVPERSSRTTYIFKSSAPVGTARDFGKRTPEMEPEEPRRFNPKNLMMVARSFGKRSDETAEEVYGLDNFWESLAAPEREGQEMEEDKLESIPLDWFVNEIVNNPDFARSVVRKFVDINQDGMLSSDELLRNV